MIINESDIDHVFQPIYTTILQKCLGKGSGCIIDSVIEHNINVWKHNISAGSSYIDLTEELDNPDKGFINIQNVDDNECFNWCLIRYLNPADLRFNRLKI